MDVPEIRYARSGDVSIAYQVFGDGPTDLVVILPFVSNSSTRGSSRTSRASTSGSPRSRA